MALLDRATNKFLLSLKNLNKLKATKNVG